MNNLAAENTLLGSPYIWGAIIILFITTYATKIIPFLLFKGDIKNRFIRSILAYLPYAVFASLIIPEVFTQKAGLVPCIVGFIIAVVLSLKNKSLVFVLIVATVATYLTMLANAPFILPLIRSIFPGFNC